MSHSVIEQCLSTQIDFISQLTVASEDADGEPVSLPGFLSEADQQKP